MKKIILIIQREFLTRVRKKTFIIGTILFPLLYLALIFGTSYIAEKSTKNLKVALVDNSGLFTEAMIVKSNANDTLNNLVLIKKDIEKTLVNYAELGYHGIIQIPATFNWKTGFDSTNKLNISTKKTYGLGAFTSFEKKLNEMWMQIKDDSLGVDATKKIILSKRFSLEQQNEKQKQSNAGAASVIGYVCAFLMYFILLLYGSQVMMGVTEEKTNRIAEVVVSSVKPFQLMIGKIVGIGLVALTQFLIWITCIFLIYNFTKTGDVNTNVANSALGQIQGVINAVNIPLTVGCFIFYLLGGFFFYSSLYAAIGSAINEDMREAQSLSFPITMLVIFSVALMAPVIKDPNSTLAVWASIIPFSSPIVMMARIPFGVPSTVAWWQLGLSMLLLIAGFMFTTWFAGRIYRTGILMYGKKPSWKEMIKWAFKN